MPDRPWRRSSVVVASSSISSISCEFALSWLGEREYERGRVECGGRALALVLVDRALNGAAVVAAADDDVGVSMLRVGLDMRLLRLKSSLSRKSRSRSFGREWYCRVGIDTFMRDGRVPGSFCRVCIGFRDEIVSIIFTVETNEE
jgi:hypothetical protein